MLKSIEVGHSAKLDTLVITPEFFQVMKHKVRGAKGVHLRTRLYPLIRNWIVVSGVEETPRYPATAFSLQSLCGSCWIYIPTKQCRIFDGKVIGVAEDIVTAPVGFLQT